MSTVSTLVLNDQLSAIYSALRAVSRSWCCEMPLVCALASRTARRRGDLFELLGSEGRCVQTRPVSLLKQGFGNRNGLNRPASLAFNKTLARPRAGCGRIGEFGTISGNRAMAETEASALGESRWKQRLPT